MTKNHFLARGITKLSFAFLLVFAAISTNGCDGFWFKAFHLSNARAEKVVRVAITKGPFAFANPTKPSAFTIGKPGLEKELLLTWAKDAGITLDFLPVANPDEVELALQSGQADLGASRYRWPIHLPQVMHGPVYDETRLGLFCQRKLRMEQLSDLKNKRVLVSRWDRNNEIEQMLAYNLARPVSFQSYDVDEMFSEVGYRKADCLISDMESGLLFNRLHTSVDFITEVTETKSIFILGNSTSSELLNSFKAWLQWSSHENKYLQIQEHYRGNLSALSYPDKFYFANSISEKLNSLKKYFIEASNISRLPWQLIAAVAYQESHWDSDARSYTGVRGMMMLTEETAQHLGIVNRTDARESLIGGARYLSEIFKSLDVNSNFSDRMALTLVAYNIGTEHLRDLQKYLIDTNQDPNSWHNIKAVLPLKEESIAEGNFRKGKARGKEAIQFVERVLAFYDILKSQR